MVQFKVCCKHESRRFLLNSYLNWRIFENKLRDLFSIPYDRKFVVSYIDEDGDEITISSDIELDDVIARSSVGISIKLSLTILSTSVAETVAEMEQLKINVDYDDDAGTHFSRTESTENETELKQNVGNRESKYNNFSSSAEEEVDWSNSDSEIYFIITNSCGSRREPKFGHAKLDSSEYFKNCPFLRDELRSHHRSPFHSDRRVHGMPYLTPEKIHPVSKTDLGEEYANESDHNGQHKYGKHGHGRHGHVRHGHGHGRVYGHRHDHGHRHGYGHNHGRHHHGPLTPEELTEKIELLNSMGFSSEYNAHYEELLKRFGGRIGRVVEILLCERKHRDEEKDKDPREDNEIHEGETLRFFEN